jgi:hypothetical protein
MQCLFSSADGLVHVCTRCGQRMRSSRPRPSAEMHARCLDTFNRGRPRREDTDSGHRRTGDGYTLDQQLAQLAEHLPPGTTPPDPAARLAVCRDGCTEWTGGGCKLLASLARCEVALPKALLGLHAPCPRWPV